MFHLYVEASSIGLYPMFQLFWRLLLKSGHSSVNLPGRFSIQTGHIDEKITLGPVVSLLIVTPPVGVEAAVGVGSVVVVGDVGVVEVVPEVVVYVPEVCVSVVAVEVTADPRGVAAILYAIPEEERVPGYWLGLFAGVKSAGVIALS